jgi:hypothetical protein
LGCLFPLGGWTTEVRRHVGGRAIAPWLLAVLPVLLVSSSTLGMGLPAPLWKLVQAWLLPVALTSGLIHALGWLSHDSDHYVRMALADYALAFAVMGTRSTSVPLIVLLLISPHLLSGPVLVTAGNAERSAAIRFHWLLLSGIPPTPVFWGRLLAVGAIAVSSQLAFVVALTICGLHLIGCVLASRGSSDPASDLPRSVVPWVLGALSLVVGVAPNQVLSRVFGS